MKKFVLLLALSLSVTLSYAQKVKESDVPKNVRESFKKSFPQVNQVKWEKEDGNFEAEFVQNGTELSAVIDASGQLLETESEISVSALPKAVSEYVSKNFPGKKIDEAAKIVDTKGEMTYEAEVGGKDYSFDATGKLIKK